MICCRCFRVSPPHPIIYRRLKKIREVLTQPPSLPPFGWWWRQDRDIKIDILYPPSSSPIKSSGKAGLVGETIHRKFFLWGGGGGERPKILKRSFWYRNYPSSPFFFSLKGEREGGGQKSLSSCCWKNDVWLVLSFVKAQWNFIVLCSTSYPTTNGGM